MAKAKRKSVPRKKSHTSSKRGKTALKSKAKKPTRTAEVRRHSSQWHSSEKRAAKKLVVLERDPMAVKLYESALKSFNQQEFSRARDAFQRVIEQFPKETEIVERSRVHLNICLQRLTRNSGVSKTAEDHYNLAIAHLNRREFDEAQAGFEKALALNPKGDYIFYGMATLESLRGRVESALKHLQRAIEMNPMNRVTASKDTDFEPIAHLEEFQALVRGTQTNS